MRYFGVVVVLLAVSSDVHAQTRSDCVIPPARYVFNQLGDIPSAIAAALNKRFPAQNQNSGDMYGRPLGCKSFD